MKALARFLTASSRPSGPLDHLHREAVVPAPLEDTFAFFADAANLVRLTPPWLGFTLVTPMPVTMRVGLEVDYGIFVYGMRIPWRSRIEVWEPGVRFVDRQVIGPYRWWHHEHRFEPAANGTRVVDHVEYSPRVAWATRGIVRRDLDRIFAYRQDSLQRYFEPLARSRAHG